MTADPLLRISDLTVRYNRAIPPREVLRGVSVSLDAGDCLVVVGPNGSGKSTMLHAIAGSLEGHASGAMALRGRSLGVEPQHRRARQIALVYQDPSRGTAAHLSLREHCRLTTAVAGRQPVAWIEMSKRLEALGTQLEGDRLAGELSGGQRQLFTVLLAILSSPSLLLLDEPTSALDAHHQALVLDAVEGHVAQGRHATIFVTHDVSEALRLGNRLLVLSARGDVQAALGPGEKARLDAPSLRALLAQATSVAWSGRADANRKGFSVSA